MVLPSDPNMTRQRDPHEAEPDDETEEFDSARDAFTTGLFGTMAPGAVGALLGIATGYILSYPIEAVYPPMSSASFAWWMAYLAPFALVGWLAGRNADRQRGDR